MIEDKKPLADWMQATGKNMQEAAEKLCAIHPHLYGKNIQVFYHDGPDLASDWKDGIWKGTFLGFAKVERKN
jgi:hypothetical protein